MAHRHDLLAIRIFLSAGGVANTGRASCGRGGTAAAGISFPASPGQYRVSCFQGAYLDCHAGLQPTDNCGTACVAHGSGGAAVASPPDLTLGTYQYATTADHGKPAVSRHLGGVHTTHAHAHQRYRLFGRGLRATPQIHAQNPVRYHFMVRVRSTADGQAVIRMARPYRDSLDAEWIHHSPAGLSRQQVCTGSDPAALAAPVP